MLVENQFAGTVQILNGQNPQNLFEHQIEAMSRLDEVDKKNSFNTLLVLPTGAGKTITATRWLLKNAIDKGKKVLWIAHRHLLLEQAADTFIRNCYSEMMINFSSFNYRIVSGNHDKPVSIKKDDNIIFASKDSLGRDFTFLNKWLKNEEIYLVIDEAHHSTAKTYRKLIDYTNKNSSKVKLLGLTATPFRTAESEKGLLNKIYTDGMVYSVNLETLIKKKILSTPVCISCVTDIRLDEHIGIKALKSIENLDIIPEKIVHEIAENKVRNRLIVKEYLDNYEKYGPTIIFALNINHAITLNKLFCEHGKALGIKSDYIVSGIKSGYVGIDISNSENEEKIKRYKNGEIQILINVNILTEGTDLPKTRTVFLTRPTVSTVLMTQMVGRALRGERVGGNSKAYIVSFIDSWENQIAWVNPESLLKEGEFVDSVNSENKRTLRMISISKIEEFVKLMDDTVDSRKLESIDFIKRVPLGMYVFSFIDEEEQERNHQILVYDSTESAYAKMIESLPELFEEYKIEDEKIPTKILEELCEISETSYFDIDMIPPFNKKDIEYLLKFYAQKASEPLFIPIDELDRKKLNITSIAKEIVQANMRLTERTEYINDLWEDENSLLKIYFDKKLFFKRQLDVEIEKLLGEFEFEKTSKNIKPEKIEIERLPIFEIREKDPKYAKELIENIYQNSLNNKGEYTCATCGKISKNKGMFQIDHIFPMSKGGLSTPENLQLLCIKCNKLKSDSL